ncbi:hypothetical protein AAC387_Pa09g0727 [Persea americana]
MSEEDLSSSSLSAPTHRFHSFKHSKSIRQRALNSFARRALLDDEDRFHSFKHLEGDSTPRFHSFKHLKGINIKEPQGGGTTRYHSFKYPKGKKEEEEEEQRLDDGEDKKEKEEEEEEEEIDDLRRTRGPLSSDPQVRLAIYIAMAHAGLAFSLALLYGLARLLQEYWRPIQWAILCSMPLRELQTALVGFWSHPLQMGLLETILAVPLAVVRIATGSLIDSQAAFVRLLRRRGSPGPCGDCIGFSKLMRWVVSFGLFVLAHERFGAAAVPAFVIPGFIAYATGLATGSDPGGVATTLSAMSSVRRGGVRIIRPPPSRIPILSRCSRYLTSFVLCRLKTIVGVGLITIMIVGSVSGFIFFSYKIGIEGKDAVISLKTHLEENNYPERMGLKQWMDEKNVPEMIDTYTTKFYETVLQQVDSLALQYNATELVDGFKQFFVGLPSKSSVASAVPTQVRQRSLSRKLHRLRLRFQKREWKVIYSDFNGAFREFLSVVTREDLVEKIKGVVLQSVDVSKRVFASSTMVLAGSTNLLFSVAVSIVSGAAGLVNFISQLMVFFWLLYYLITSDSGGVMDHVLGMLPVSKSTRVQCAAVLNHAVSSVLLATAKVALFQGFLTYLLFRFYHIHFLYMSTFIALMSAVLPITPIWLSSIPAAAQLAVDSRYIEAVVLGAIHVILLDYGTVAIQDEIPGQSAYLTGLSILGGMALFQSVLEGAIMGPLLLTVMTALKNLYVEFVLASAKETSK